MNTIEQFRGRMLAPQACAEALDNSEHTIHRWIKDGKIKAVKIGHRMTRIDGDSLADFLLARAIEPGQVAPLPATLAKAIEKRKRDRASSAAASE